MKSDSKGWARIKGERLQAPLASVTTSLCCMWLTRI